MLAVMLDLRLRCRPSLPIDKDILLNLRTPRTLPSKVCQGTPIASRLLRASALLTLFTIATAAWSQQSSGPLLASSSQPGTPDASLPDAPGSLPAVPASLPDDPTANSASSSLDFNEAAAEPDAGGGGQATPVVIRKRARLEKYIHPGETVRPLSAGEKLELSIKDSFSPFAFVGWVAAAGYEQAFNGSPNYGTNAGGFAERFGAAAARASSEKIFSDGVLAAVLREDPRYYRMGPGHNVVKRLGYALSRTFITRTDSGQLSPNSSLIAGNLGGAYLTKAYYPDLNTSSREVLKTFGGSLGGSALGFAISEFIPQKYNIFHDLGYGK
jgi:hypothetical protein